MKFCPTLRGIDNAHEAWEKLKSLYETNNEIRVLLLKNELQGLKMSESDGVTNHVTRMQELKDQLLSIDQKIDDKELVTMLLNNLPRSYNTFVTSLYVSSRTAIPSFGEVVGMLLLEEQRHKHQDDEDPDRAFASRSRG
eukprot:Gb_04039 [translate_table: standard]